MISAPTDIVILHADGFKSVFCTGTVRLKLYKGNVTVNGRKSGFSLYDKVIASFEDDKGLYNQVLDVQNLGLLRREQGLS